MPAKMNVICSRSLFLIFEYIIVNQCDICNIFKWFQILFYNLLNNFI